MLLIVGVWEGDTDSVIRGWNMGTIVVGGTLMLAAVGLCGACMTEQIDVVEEVVEDVVVGVDDLAVTRGGSNERSRMLLGR